MKRIISSLVFLTLLITQTTAQLMSITPKGGGAYADLNTLDEPMYDEYENGGKIGAAGGIQFDFAIAQSESMRFSPELFFIQNGTKEVFYTSINGFANDLVNRKVNLDYIGLYLPFEVEVIDDMGNGGFFNINVFTDFAVNARTVDGDGGMNSIEFSSGFDKVDFGVSAALGFAQNGISIQLGYNYGLKNIEFKDSLSDYNPNGNDGEIYKVNNKGFTLQIGYIIPTE